MVPTTSVAYSSSAAEVLLSARSGSLNGSRTLIICRDAMVNITRLITTRANTLTVLSAFAVDLGPTSVKFMNPGYLKGVVCGTLHTPSTKHLPSSHAHDWCAEVSLVACQNLQYDPGWVGQPHKGQRVPVSFGHDS